MAEDPRCDFLALALFPQKAIINTLSISQMYQLSKKSQKWQKVVKEANIKLDCLEVEFGDDEENLSKKFEIYVNVKCGEQEMLKVCIPNGPDSTYHMESNGSHIVIDYAKDLNSETAMADQLSIVGDRLMDMFTFEKRAITISPGPNFLKNIWSPFLRENFRNDVRIRIRNRPNPLPLEHLVFVLQHFHGEELITGNVEEGEELAQEIDFERITIQTTNWLSKKMLKNLEAKRVEIDPIRDSGVRMPLVYICLLIQSWTNGEMPDLELFKCRLYWKPADLQLMRNYLTQISQYVQQPAGEEMKRHYLAEIQANIRSSDGKFAYILIDSTQIGAGQWFLFRRYEYDTYAPWMNNNFHIQ